MTNSAIVSWLALCAALVSAAFTGGMYFAARDELTQQRDAVLMGERVVACAEIDRRTGTILAELNNSAYMLSRGRDEHTQQDVNRTLSLLVDLQDAMTLRYLGPDRLSLAQSELMTSLTVAHVELMKQTSTRESVEAEVVKARDRLVAFNEACVTAVSAYRANR